MTSGKARVAIVYPSGQLHRTPEEVQARLAEISELNLDCVHLPLQNESENGYTAGTTLERATQLSFALTSRKFSTLWAARGGFGATETLRALEHMLPPVLPPKTLFGFSDISGLGVYLACRFPNFTYVHANHAFDNSLFTGPELDRTILFSLLNGEKVKPLTLPVDSVHSRKKRFPGTLTGSCIPLNLSLAESLSTLRQVQLPPQNILFIEDLNEDLFRILRKCDSLINSGFLADTVAIVLGTFNDCPNAKNENVNLADIADLLSKKIDVPILVCPVFGHDKPRLPLVCHSNTSIVFDANGADITLSFNVRENKKVATEFAAGLYLPPLGSRVHFTGIGGTGMAAVAGLFKTAGFPLSGSDNPIYPPMDKVIKDLGIEPAVGYQALNIETFEPDAIVLANVITRKNAELKPNLELEHLLKTNLPMLSFPSALRKFFLKDSLNIVVSGTHGKTTTTSLIAHSLTELGTQPSFLIGGAPLNFSSGFALNNKKLFVLEGDEYDSAFFDKGPKFLHYEPSIALINNIEFDHADIYANVEAIEEEFLLLARLTHERGGIVIANLADPRVLKIAHQSGANVIGFSDKSMPADFPVWELVGYKTHSLGSTVTVRSPSGMQFAVESGVFGKHNALNIIAAFAVLQAHDALGNSLRHAAKADLASFCAKATSAQCASWSKTFVNFGGVKRRFELITLTNDVAVFDDFAHHPTAIDTTLDAFKDYAHAAGRKGRLIACFDPRNATMRRSVLARQLAQSFSHADLVFLGKVPKDLRLNSEETLDGPAVAKACGSKASYFDDNDQLCNQLATLAKPGDTVVFMSSGAFDGLPGKFAALLKAKFAPV